MASKLKRVATASTAAATTNKGQHCPTTNMPSDKTQQTKTAARQKVQQQPPRFYNICRNGSSARNSNQNGTHFAYDLSSAERKQFNKFDTAMKIVPSKELALLQNGERMNYLQQRYIYDPKDKYNYPEATSWRYGWFHK